MKFQSAFFLAFLFVVCVVYYPLPTKYKKYWLLLVSYAFYINLSVKFFAVLAGVTLASFGAGLMVERLRTAAPRLRKVSMAISVLVTLSPLLLIKYGNFILSNVFRVVSVFSAQMQAPAISLLQPLGISFFSLQAVGYLVDVYRGPTGRHGRGAEKSLVCYALFLGFFPLLTSGPIERSNNLLRQIHEPVVLDTYNIRHGLLMMLQGYFLKYVIADRLNILVNTVFADHTAYSGEILVLAVVGYGIQLYCDFAGISSLAIGVGQMLGFSIIQNFDTPYFSLSCGEFWRRWHISLSSWFMDYLYIPLGGNRKGTVRKYCNLMITMLVSGLWHGAGWNFIVWGGLNGLYQVIGQLLQPARKKISEKLHINPDSAGNKFFRMAFTFCCIDFAWLFFRANGIRQALDIIYLIVTKHRPWLLFNGKLLTLGLDAPDMAVLFISLAILLVLSVFQYHKVDVWDALMKQGFAFRMTVYVVCIVAVLVFALYGSAYSASSFIYADF